MGRWAWVGVAFLLAGCGGRAGEDLGPGTSVLTPQSPYLPTSIVSDGTWVYWASRQDLGAPLARVRVTGGESQVLLPGLLGTVLAVDDANLYYLDEDADGIYRIAKDGSGSPALLSDAPTAMNHVESETILAGMLYWVEIPDITTDVNEVHATPLAGGPITSLGPAPQDPAGGIEIIGVTSETVFVTNSSQTWFFPIDSGATAGMGIRRPVPGLATCLPMVSDRDAVYCSSDQGIRRVASDGTTMLLSGGGLLALDDTYVYSIMRQGLTNEVVMRVPKTGGAPTMVGPSVSASAEALAVDPGAAYLVGRGNEIVRIAK